MLRLNTQKEIDIINKLIEAKSTRLIYYNARTNKYREGWVSTQICNLVRDNVINSGLFFSLKHPGHSVINI